MNDVKPLKDGANSAAPGWAAAMLDGEPLIRQLIDWLPQLIWTCTPEGQCDFVSRQWSAFTGRTLDELLGHGWLASVHPECRATLIRDWQTAILRKADYRGEFRLRRHDGEYRWFEARATPYCDASSRIVKWFGSNSDITDARDIREALSEEKERFITMAATSPGVVHSFRLWPDGHMSFPFAAPSIVDIYGLSAEDLARDSRKALACTHPDDVDRVLAGVTASAADMTPWRAEFRVRHRSSGREVWVEGHSRPVREPDGSITWHGVLTDITHRKQIEDQLRRERDRFKRITSAVPGVIWVIRVENGRAYYEYVSKTVEEIFGASVEELMQDAQHWSRRVHPDDIINVTEAFNRSIVDNQPFVVTYRLSHPTRGELWLEGRSSAPDFPEPGVARSHGYITDITERRRFEDALRESEERFSVAFQSSLGGNVLIRKTDDTIVEANPAFLSIIGYARDQVIGTRAVDLRLARDDQTRHALEAAFHGERAMVNHELSFARRDGSIGYGVISVQAVEISGQQYGLGILTDITERKAAERALHEYRERLLAALEAGGMSTWIYDREQNLLWWDDAAPKLWGRSRTALSNNRVETILQFVHPDDRTRVAEALRRSIDDGEDLRVEFRNQRTDGAFQWLSMRAHAQPASPGERGQLTGVCVDATARKLAEESQLNSQKMEALGTLAGGIAHDFNNVLLAISGNARLALAETAREHPAFQSLQEIRRASDRASDLVRHILTFSRHQEATREVTAVQPIVEEALGLLRPALPAMIDIQSAFGDDVPKVEANATQLHQVIVNLVTNAAQAIGARTGKIRIEVDNTHVDRTMAATSIDLREGRYARIIVTDDGSGMDKATIARVFDPFFTTKPPGQGTGLGLSVVHGIVKNHRGAIAVSSEVGKGSTFCVYLPATQQAAVTTAMPPLQLSIGTGQRVLYIDDDEAVAFLSTRLMTRQGYRVTAFTNPQEALSAFKAQPHEFDVVVTDLSMPTFSGFDVTREVLKVRPDIPVLMTSGYVRAEDQAAAREAGVRELLLKPNTIDELSIALDRVFKDLRKK